MYKFARTIVYGFVKLIRRFQVEGKENIPKDGGCILAANHRSYWDPVFVGLACPRVINFMAKKKLFEHPFLGFLLRHLKAFPVNQQIADRKAIKTALDILESQQVLGIFPEGTRSQEGLLPPQAGTAMLALKTNVPIIPVAIQDQRGFRGRVKVKIGSPLLPGSEENTQLNHKEHLKQVSLKIMQELERLLQEN